MAITRIGGANAISGSITSSNLPSGSVLQVFNYKFLLTIKCILHPTLIY